MEQPTSTPYAIICVAPAPAQRSNRNTRPPNTLVTALAADVRRMH